MKPMNRISYLLLESTRNNTVLSYVRSTKRRPWQPQVWIAFVSTRAANSLGRSSNPRTHCCRSLRRRTGCSPMTQSSNMSSDRFVRHIHVQSCGTGRKMPADVKKRNRRVGRTGVGRRVERKRTFGGLKAYLRATDHTSNNIISRDLYFSISISLSLFLYLYLYNL
jgi:hypothetical protein